MRPTLGPWDLPRTSWGSKMTSSPRGISIVYLHVGEPSNIREMVLNAFSEIGVFLPNNQRHRTLHIQKDVLPYALCYLLCPVSAALASIFRIDSISTSYHMPSKGAEVTCERENEPPHGPTGIPRS